jgi:hypothetical protein
MKLWANNYVLFHNVKALIGIRAIICLASLFTIGSDFALAQQKDDKMGADQPANGAVARFIERAKEYAKLREELEGKLPKLPEESSPEKIEAHKEAFAASVRAARSGAKPGDLFSQDIADHIRRVIKQEFKGEELKQLREGVLKADTKGVPLRVNHPYPETKEWGEMPPTLLLKLPQLPKQLRYRFVGRHLLLVDREALIIVDYIRNALP